MERVGRPWTTEEDELLKQAVAVHGETDMWKTIALSVPGRTNKACRKRWLHSLSPSVKKTAWTKEEDALLLSLYAVHSTKWALIARSIPGRTDDACSKRYREALDPALKKDDWTSEEDDRLLDAYSRLGGRWSQVGQSLQRSGLACRNRWRLLQRKQSKSTPGQGTNADATGASYSWEDMSMLDPQYWMSQLRPYPQFGPGEYGAYTSGHTSLQDNGRKGPELDIPSFSPSDASAEVDGTSPVDSPFHHTLSSLRHTQPVPEESSSVNDFSHPPLNPRAHGRSVLPSQPNASVPDAENASSPSQFDDTPHPHDDGTSPSSMQYLVDLVIDRGHASTPALYSAGMTGPGVNAHMDQNMAPNTIGHHASAGSITPESPSAEATPEPEALHLSASNTELRTELERHEHEVPVPSLSGAYQSNAGTTGRPDRVVQVPRLSSALAVSGDTSVTGYACGHPDCWPDGAASSLAKYATSGELVNHFRADHPGHAPGAAKLYRCGLDGCAKAWASVNGLQYHLQISKAHFRQALNSAVVGARSHSKGEGQPETDAPRAPDRTQKKRKLHPCPHAGCPNQYKQLSGLRYHLDHVGLFPSPFTGAAAFASDFWLPKDTCAHYAGAIERYSSDSGP
ncbi:hypothetical protein PUNSTDRAFT_129070 [Punctularia strigosozonata HHB-11173 SS5]|uniref:uncharacterized protein n=1 Tax=Punctularia strigosozonata (strain HHB-11173) TaxID=741275 RepID=UPI000441690A|nr:uncharacterized protein PUNSTDRAFT_129070 [Punctularia strigosozonata HHB-11173 SS5]EIN13381.1 hypothetical protein PUNSTDRAFT_129070 [Punctularia strigosozonata HHB-11173 SS5]